MSVPMKDGGIDSTSERSLPEESTYEGGAPKRWKEIAILPSSHTRDHERKLPEESAKNLASRKSTGKSPMPFTRECSICGHSQQDPVSTPCGDVFCRLCILKDLEEQSATGKYNCPRCSGRFRKRPALHPHQRQSYQHGLPTSSLYTEKAVQRTRELLLGESLKSTGKSLMPVTSPTSLHPYQDGLRTSSLYTEMGEKGDGDSFQSFLMSHKASLKRRIEQLGEGITKAASHTNNRIYITKEKKIINCNDIFEPFKDSFLRSETRIRTVITRGVAGIGKTTSVHKFILDCADGKANEDVNCVFMLPFWKLNLVKDVSCSLQKLLLNFHPELKELADLKKFDDSNIVVIFDGLDESQLSLDFQNNQMVCDITEISSVHTLITNVIKGNLLPFAKVWITSDASSAKLIPSWYINRLTDILPFSDSQMEECVREQLNDVTEASKIIQQIKMSRGLYAMCQIPVLCSIAVRAVKNMPQGESRMIQTSTELYSCFLLGEMTTEANTVQVEGEEMDEGKPQRTRREVMLKFAQLAFRHLMKNHFTFSEQDLKECDIDVSEAASLRGICIDINQEKSEFFPENFYRFAHVSIQGFLAALCVFDAHICKNMEILKDFFDDVSNIQPEDVSLDILLRSAADKVLKRKNGHQDFFLRFLLGMSLESNTILLQGLLKDISTTSETAKSTLKYIKDLGKKTAVPLKRCIALLYCQIEMQDPCVLEDIESLRRSQQGFVSSYWSEISTLIKMSGQILDEFKLKEHHPSRHHSLLSMFLSCCRKAQLSNCHLSRVSYEVVASVLQQPHCPLRELDISGNYMMDSGVELLCSGLKSPNCKLQILRISNCHLSRVSYEVVASALQQPHCSLRELDMSGNYLMDSGVEVLCSGLKSPNCKLQILRISHCDLSRVSCEVVASVLQQPHCPLRELDMSGNYMMDSGVEVLCSGLQSPNCKLQILRLSGCGLTNRSCLILKSVLNSYHSCLRELDVSNNRLKYSGLNLLKERLEDAKCKMETLTTKPILRLNFTPQELASGSHPSHLRTTAVLSASSNLLRPQTDTVLPEPSHTMKSDFPKIQPQSSVSQPQQSTPDDLFKGLSIDSKDDDENDSEIYAAPGLSGAELPHISTQKIERGRFCGQPPDNKGEVEDVCNAEDRECNEDVEVFTPESTASERTTYRFSCSSAGVYQCRYTGLVFQTDMAAEVQYQSVSWDYKKLDHEGLVAAGPLFKMKGLYGTVSQLGFPHCEIISSDKTPSLTVIHITGKTFEMLQPLRTSDTHVFLNITGFCEKGLAKKGQKEENRGIRALVLLFVNHLTLNIFLLPKNVVLREVFEKRKKMTEPSIEIYVDTTSKCKLIPDEYYSLTCSSKNTEHKVNPKSADFDNEIYEDYYPTFQVALTNLEPVDLYLKESRQNENGDVTQYDWQSCVDLQVYQSGGTRAESSLSSPYTPPGQDFFHKHKAALETRLGLLRPILSELETHRVLNFQEREEVENKERSIQNRTLLLMLQKKGGPAQEEFYRVLKKCDEYLVKDLERPHDYRTSAGYHSLHNHNINSLTQQTAVC